MQITKIAKIIAAQNRLQNSTYEVTNMTINPDDVESGELCFCADRQACQTAFQNGAAAIVCKRGETFPVQQQCIVLEVEDVGIAALRLAGYVMDESQISIELLDERTLTFFEMIVTHKRSFARLPQTWQKAFETVMEAKKPLLVTTDERFFKALRPAAEAFSKKAPGYVVSADSLFRTTFKIEKYIYQYKPLSHLHLDPLRRAVALCETCQLPYSLENLRYTRHLYPIFPEGEPTIQEVMKNDRVVILSDNLEDILEAREYAADVGHWMAKTVVMVPPKTKVEGVKYPTFYHSNEEAVELAGSLAFNYLFIYTKDPALAGMMERAYL